MIKTVIFDIDDTMYDYTRGNRLALEALKDYCVLHLEITGTTFHRTLKEANERMVAKLGSNNAAIHNRLLRYQTMLEILDKPLFPHAVRMAELYWKTMIDCMEPEPGLADFIRSLKENGVRVGVGTNMTAYVQYKKLERLGITPMIDFLVTSEEAGVEKPDAVFYQHCLLKAGCKPEECLFIGDGLKGDVLAPQQAGMHSLWYQPSGRPDGEKEYVPGIQKITSFSECLEEGFLGSFS